MRTTVADCPTDRILRRVTMSAGPMPDHCWRCSYSLNNHGYSTIRVKGKLFYAHRLTYEHFVGLIPKGFDIDHLCRTPDCVNPGHLEAVTHRQNVLRGLSLSAVTARTGVCQRGHSMADAYLRPGSGKYMCRPCMNARSLRRSGTGDLCHNHARERM